MIHCRRVLKYTYVIGYYMDDATATRQLFERHQEMLEENTERLQEFIETKKLKNLDRTELINYTRITERFRNSLLDDIHDEAALETMRADATPAAPQGSSAKASRVKRAAPAGVQRSTSGGVATRSRVAGQNA